MVRVIRFEAEDEEARAGKAWLESLEKVQLVRHGGKLTRSTEVLWLHGVDRAPDGLLAWLNQGGRLLATGTAALLPARLGLEPIPPDERVISTWSHQDDEFWFEDFKSFEAFPHIRGMAAFGPHPLFAGLHQGTYTWAPAEGEPWQLVCYRQARPARGRPVAVERSFIHLNPERILAWEQTVGEGGVLCLGGYVSLAARDDLLARQLRALLTNAILGDAIPHRERALPVALWPSPGRRTIPERGVPVPELPAMDAPWHGSGSTLALGGPVVRDEPWTLAGRRMLLVGGERNGLAEVWSHPFRVLHRARVRLGLEVPEARDFTAAPDQVVRTSRAGTTLLTERWTTALELPVLVWDLELNEPRPLELSWEVDLRRMWPYPPGAFGDIRWSRSEDGRRLWVGASGAPVQLVFSLSSGTLNPSRHRPSQERAVLPVVVQAEGSIRLTVVAAVDGSDLAQTVRALERKTLAGLQRQREQHAAQIASYQSSLECPDPDLPAAFEWAKVRCDSFVAETPGVGRSLLAGYAASRPGWGDGRPGYAWYFGRDACWTAFAQLAAGDREAPRDVLRFLARNQDVSGKVLHEYTTSGLVHYDAADSTPLFLLLAGRYAAWDADLEFLRPLWPALERAWRFCLETDRDGDGLIENSRVGHGWIEHGPLGGAHVTLYLAACWIAALESLAPLAEALGHPEIAQEMEDRAARGKATVRERFHLDGEYVLGLMADGRPLRHRTAMLAVPLLLGVVPVEDTTAWFEAMAGDGFSAPWGVRMIARDHPLFLPDGYHRGAVWPLYTGWVSLAEWKGGREEAALHHLRANARLARERERGAFDEVLHGTEPRPAGVCPDQAWSAAMVILPVVEGLFGVTPSAMEQCVTIAPALPPGWNRMVLRRLRVGRTVLDLLVRRRPGQWFFRAERKFGPPIQLHLDPRGVPEGQVLLDDVVMGRARLSFQVSDRHTVTTSW